MREVKKEFSYVFQLTKMIVFKVEYYTLGSNAKPYFSTSAYEFVRNKKDYRRGGQAQNDLLTGKAREFWKKWDKHHLKNLTDAEHTKLLKDIEELKEEYNYLYRQYDIFNKPYISGFPFSTIVELSKETPKKKEG